MPRQSEPIRITTATRSRQQDIAARQRRYLISMTIRTLCFVLAIVSIGHWWLWVFVAAFHYRPSIDGVLVAFGLANVLAAIPLTPGGLGVIETVLTSTLVGFGAPSSVAILGVLSYLSIFLTIFLLAHRVARAKDAVLAPTAIACGAAISSLVIGSQLLETLALPQLAYLICFIGGLVVVMSQAQERA